MRATTPASVPEEAVGRLAGALLNPRPTFEDIARKPSWQLPSALGIVAGLWLVYLLVKAGLVAAFS